MSCRVHSSTIGQMHIDTQKVDQTAEVHSPHTSKVAELAKGAALGMTVTVTTTPAITFKDLVISGKGFRHLFSQGPMMAGRMLFTGGLMQSISAVPSMAIQRCIYSSDSNERLTPAQKMLKAFGAGYLSAAGSVGSEKATLQARQPYEVRPPFTIMFDNYKQGGLKSVNQGFHLTGIRKGCYSVGYLFLWPLFDGKAAKYLPTSIPRWIRNTVSSSTAIGAMMALTAPFDNARAEQQLSSKDKPLGIVDSLKRVKVKQVVKSAGARATLGAVSGPAIVVAEEVLGRI